MTTLSVPKVGVKRAQSTERLSRILNKMARNVDQKISVKEICEALGDRSFGTFLLVFCIPNLIPMPPGSSALLGIPMVIIAFQIMVGYSGVKLPKFIANYEFKAETFKMIVEKITPSLRKSETLLKTRYWPLGSFIGERVFGFFTFILAIIVTVPIPLGNWPPAFAIAFLAAAYTRRDGLTLAIGTALGFASIALVGFVLTGGVLIIQHIF